jgi:hypothetical protein
MPPSHSRPYNAEEDALLGTDTDAAIANAKFNRFCRNIIAAARARHVIRPALMSGWHFHTPPPSFWILAGARFAFAVEL